MRYISIIPLVGGETIGFMKTVNSFPSCILSYSAFTKNDQHLIKYLRESGWNGDYILLDKTSYVIKEAKVVNTVCPCAGLSNLSSTSSADSKVNEWLYITADYVLSKIRPRVFWGENAVRLSTQSGSLVANRMFQIGQEYGYSFTLYKTKCRLHGLPQKRARTFYFFWDHPTAPILQFYSTPSLNYKDYLLRVTPLPDDPMKIFPNKAKASDDPFYKYVLQVIEGGISHQEYMEKIKRTHSVMDAIQYSNGGFEKAQLWFKQVGFTKEVETCIRIQKKLDQGKGYWQFSPILIRGTAPAFVGAGPMRFTHPIEDRYLSVREGLSLMGMPEDFNLIDPIKNVNHVCQNVPVYAAMDMSSEIVKFLSGDLDYSNSTFVLQDNINKQIQNLSSLYLQAQLF